MGEDERYAAGYRAGFAEGFAAGKESAERLDALEAYVNNVSEHVAELNARVNDVGLRLKQLEHPKMTMDEALDTFDTLKRYNTALTLPSFAAQYGLSYEALRKARTRRRKRDRDMSSNH